MMHGRHMTALFRVCLIRPRGASVSGRLGAVQPEIRPWIDGRIRCHFPLGDPDRHARIAANGPVGAKGVP